MAGKKIQNWAFVAPKMSRDLSEYFEGILDFIKDDPSVFLHAFTFEDPNIAFHLNVSIRKIKNDFSATYGHALRDEIAAQRLDLICTALRTSNEPIKALVSRSGFSNMSQATRAFKQRFGLTMNEYRASL